jgi:outer membrane protein
MNLPGMRVMVLAAGVSALSLMAPPALAANTLEEALAAAYRGNPTLLAERARLRATDENVAQAVSGWRPTVTVNANYGRQRTEIDRQDTFNPQIGAITPGFSATVTSDPITGNVTISQPLFRGFRTLNTTRRARAEVEAGRANLINVEQQVLLDTVQAYMDVIRDEAVLNLRRNNVDVLGRQLQAARDRFEVGEITRTDVAQAEARLSGAHSNLAVAEAALRASRANFQRVVGEAPGALLQPPFLPELPATEDAAVSMALARNPRIVAARRQEEAARFAVNAAKGALLPSLSLQGQYLYNQDQTQPGVRSETTQATLQLSAPLYQGGAEHSDIRRAKQQQNEARLRVAEAERQVIEQTINAWEQLRAAQSTIKSGREQVRANEIAFEGVQQEAQVGARTTLDVLDAEQELLDSRVSLVRAERDAYFAGFALLAAAGVLNAEFLGLPVDIYDPARNYRDVSGRWIGFDILDE